MLFFDMYELTRDLLALGTILSSACKFQSIYYSYLLKENDGRAILFPLKKCDNGSVREEIFLRLLLRK